MAKQSNKRSRAPRRQGDASIKLMVAGLAFAVGPLFLSKSTFGKALAALAPVGWLMLAAGALWMWLVWRSERSRAARAPAVNSVLMQQSQDRSADPRAPIAPLVADPGSDAAVPDPAFLLEPARPQAWGKVVFEVIEWRRFEAVVERLFQLAGFQTQAKSHGADGGVDVWLYSRHQPGEPVSLVQCKHWRGRRVGVDKVRELRGVMAAQSIKRGQFVTTSSYTPEATAFARQNGINLVDVNGLLGLIARRTSEEQAVLLDVALEGDYWRPTCVNCGVKLVGRIPRTGGSAFWGCSNYPRCRTTMAMRRA